MAEAADPRIGELIGAIEAGKFRDLIQAGWGHEAAGELRTAAATYRTALQSLPRLLSPTLRPVLDHAKMVVEENDLALEAFLKDRLGGLRGRQSQAPLGRVDKSLDILLRKRRVYRPQPSFMYIPELPAIEFYDRADFPWLETVEAATDDIRAELLDVLADGPARLEPYINLDGAPHDRWRELNHSRRWSVYYLWREGVAQDDNLSRCPRTAAALRAWPQCELLGTAPNAVFSILEAKTRIPPHGGVNNAQILVHLPLIVPPGCGFRVGAETREWEPGKALIFDDTIEHEAWNNSDEPRAVMIFSIWNPFLSFAEREMITAATACVGEFYGPLPSYTYGASS
jgi:aspartate beta-hydroxylase